MTRVVIAPDSFKGSIAAADAARALAKGWRDVRPSDDLVLRPMADGGEGTLDAFAAAVPAARRMPVTVTGPDGAPTDAAWLLLPGGGGGGGGSGRGGSGVVELASTSGIELLQRGGEGELHPWDASTRGFGEAIAAALDYGVDRLVLGIGSSASTDAGIGMLSALGACFESDDGVAVADGLRGAASVSAADLSPLRSLPPGGVVVLSDVTNPLCGAHGAAAVFGPQKGLAPADIAAADAALARVAALVRADPRTPGAGAAGGTGFALLAWGARLAPGATEVGELVGLRDALASADLVVTGEGAYDGQSAAGKVPAYVATCAADAGVRAALVAGRIATDADVSGFAASVSLTDLAGSGAASLDEPARWLRVAGAALAWSVGPD